MGPDYKTEASGRLELTVPSELAGLRLDQALARLLPQHSRSRISGWMRAGEVQVGIVTAFIGAPFFIWILAAARRGWCRRCSTWSVS